MTTSSKKPNRSLNPMDYTFNEVDQLSRFVTETGKILPRKMTGTFCETSTPCHQSHQTSA